MVQTNSYGHNFFLVLQMKREITTICIRVHIIKGGTLIFCLSISMNINFQQFFQGKPVYLTEFIQWNLKEHEEIENTEDIFIIMPPRLYQPKIFQAFSCPSSQLSSPPQSVQPMVPTRNVTHLYPCLGEKLHRDTPGLCVLF